MSISTYCSMNPGNAFHWWQTLLLLLAFMQKPFSRHHSTGKIMQATMFINFYITYKGNSIAIISWIVQITIRQRVDRSAAFEGSYELPRTEVEDLSSKGKIKSKWIRAKDAHDWEMHLNGETEFGTHSKKLGRTWDCERLSPLINGWIWRRRRRGGEGAALSELSLVRVHWVHCIFRKGCFTNNFHSKESFA